MTRTVSRSAYDVEVGVGDLEMSTELGCVS